ncbi:MAG: tyrosine-type recombinase/integrase [Cytophagales bacterium]|nr:tyrosine-type recombinase/integrase [Bernardetiaceae bacterium]MDW8203470.1 tyrosine-type recombinase/integrase [Cytophagales bacterium]
MGAKQNPTIINRFIDFIALQRRYSQHTQKAYLADLQQFEQFLALLSEGEKSIITQADYHDVRAWVISLLDDEKITARSINRKLSALRSFYRFAIQEQLIASSPLRHLKALKADKPITPFLPLTDAKQLWETFLETPACDFTTSREQAIIALLYTTGIRVSELINLKISDLSFENQQLKVWGKGNKQRIVPIISQIFALLKNYLEIKSQIFGESFHSPLICTDKGEKAYPMLIYRTVRKYLDMITTIERRSPHVLRHSYATHLMDGGADLNAVKELLGHSSLAATQVYTHTSIEKLRKVFQDAHPRS